MPAPALRGVVEDLEYRGDRIEYRIRVGDTLLVAVEAASGRRDRVAPGDRVGFEWSRTPCTCFRQPISAAHQFPWRHPEARRSPSALRRETENHGMTQTPYDYVSMGFYVRLPGWPFTAIPPGGGCYPLDELTLAVSGRREPPPSRPRRWA
jgi:hypothetical protein